MESRSTSSSTSVTRDANLPPIGAWNAFITVGSFSFSRSNLILRVSEKSSSLWHGRFQHLHLGSLKLRKNIFKINISGAIRGIKLKLWRIVHNISLYKNFVFNCRCLNTFVAMATLNFHRLRMGNWKLPFHCGYFDKSSFKNVYWVILYQTFCQKLSIWLVVMATKMLNLRKIFKNQLFRSYMGDKAETL